MATFIAQVFQDFLPPLFVKREAETMRELIIEGRGKLAQKEVVQRLVWTLSYSQNKRE